jgi:hypothetical protein
MERRFVAGIAAAGCGQFQSRATVGDSVPRGGADLQAHQHRGCEPAGNRFERSGPPRPVIPFPVSFPLSLHQAPPPASPPEKVARERGAGENRKGFPRVVWADRIVQARFDSTSDRGGKTARW